MNEKCNILGQKEQPQQQQSKQSVLRGTNLLA